MNRLAITIVLVTLLWAFLPGLQATLLAADCNSNGIEDACDIDCGSSGGPCDVPGCGLSGDCNTNGVPDECEAIVLGTRLFVDQNALGANDGSDWQNAFTELQSALCFAASLGGVNEIWVAAGTYTPSAKTVPDDDRTATFQLLEGVGIYGGFAGNEDPATFDLNDRDFIANETILSGDLNGDDVPVACTQDSPVCDSNGAYAPTTSASSATTMARTATTCSPGVTWAPTPFWMASPSPAAMPTFSPG